MKNKYEEFYYEEDKQNHPACDYWELYDKSPLQALEKYEGNIFCPLCELAPLTVAKGNERRYMKVVEANMSKHAEWCSYRLDKANKKETEYFYEDLDQTDIQNRLISCLNRMLKKHTPQYGGGMGNLNTVLHRKDKENFFDIETEAKKKKYLPHRNLYSKQLETEIDVTRIYYGKCALYLFEYIPEGETEIKKYYLKILNAKTKKIICDVSISTYVFKYLEEMFSEISREKENASVFYLCFAGCMEKNKFSYTCKLKDSRMIVLERME